MPLAVFVVATDVRPSLLRAALSSMVAQDPLPPGWTYEIVVAGAADDRIAQEVVLEKAEAVVGDAARRDLQGLSFVACARRSCGARRMTALEACPGAELVMAADDDDLQSPMRAAAAIAAYTRGYHLTATKAFRFLDLASGNVCFWDGRPQHVVRGRTGTLIGTSRSYARKLLAPLDGIPGKTTGWRDLPRLVEKDLQDRLNRVSPPVKEHDLSPALMMSTICLQHDRNIWTDRSFPARHRVLARGDFYLRGEGHYRQIVTFPLWAVSILDAAFGVGQWGWAPPRDESPPLGAPLLPDDEEPTPVGYPVRRPE